MIRDGTKPIVIVSIILVFVTIIGVFGTLFQYQSVQGTGCPTNFVAEHIDTALKAYAAGDAKEVKNQLDLAKEAVTVASEEKE